MFDEEAYYSDDLSDMEKSEKPIISEPILSVVNEVIISGGKRSNGKNDYCPCKKKLQAILGGARHKKSTVIKGKNGIPRAVGGLTIYLLQSDIINDNLNGRPYRRNLSETPSFEQLTDLVNELSEKYKVKHEFRSALRTVAKEIPLEEIGDIIEAKKIEHKLFDYANEPELYYTANDKEDDRMVIAEHLSKLEDHYNKFAQELYRVLDKIKK